MIDKINAPLRALAGRLNKNLYLVGGCVRNYLIDGKLSGDFDLASANTESELLAAFGGDFAPVAVYPRTGTVMFKDRAGTHYEHTAFRGEEYEKGGGHTPARTYFTEDIAADAVRRDFKCNAVYYDLKNAVYADPLGGVADIKNKTLDTLLRPKRCSVRTGSDFCGCAALRANSGLHRRGKSSRAQKNSRTISGISRPNAYTPNLRACSPPIRNTPFPIQGGIIRR